MKLFNLHRTIDTSGLSGTGIVAEGVIMSYGKVILCWKGQIQSIVIYDSIDDLIKITCNGGNSCIEYLN